MNASPIPVAARVAALRQRRAALGLVRLDVYAHPADHAAIKRYVERLARKRQPNRRAMSPAVSL